MAEPSEYAHRAAVAVEAILNEHHAVVRPELEARIAEGEFEGSPNNIDPHHVGSAIRHLQQSGKIIKHTGPARGGRQSVETIQPADQHRRATKIENAAARKRLLLARYNGWAEATVRHPNGLIGPAGEEATRKALIAAGSMQPAAPNFGPISELLGVRLPGAADSGGYLVPLTNNLPGRPITVIIEVKNIRHWIYPWSIELYQVLNKAAHLQLHHLDLPIVPVLVCRRAHRITFNMAKQLGFHVIAMGIQYAGNVQEGELLEVRNELHFHDLHAGTGPTLRVQDQLRKTVPRVATVRAEAWEQTCAAPSLPDLFNRLNHIRNTIARRSIMDELRDAASTELDAQGGW